MSIDLTKITKTNKQKAPFIVIYGEGGVGKTTFAAEAQNPIFLDFENGSYHLDVQRIEKGYLIDTNKVLDVLRALYTQEHAFQTIVIDSLDALEMLIHKQIEKEYNVNSIADIDYGRGYVAAFNVMDQIIHALTKLNQDKGMEIIIIGHSKVTLQEENPDEEAYSKYVIAVHKHIQTRLVQLCDFILFAKQKVYTTTQEGSFGKKTKKGHTGERVMYSANPGYCLAKSRAIGFPEELPLSYKAFKQALQATQPKPKLEESKKSVAKEEKVNIVNFMTLTPTAGVSVKYAQ